EDRIRYFHVTGVQTCALPIYLPKMATGEMIGCFGLTEPNAGSDAANQQTTAKKDGDHYILNGQKTWISNGSIADVAIIIAQTDKIGRAAGRERRRGVREEQGG